MKHKTWSLFAVFCFVLMGGTVSAAPLTEQKATALLSASGVAATLEQISDGMSKGIKESANGSMPSDQRRMMVETYAKTFTPERLKSVVRAELVAAISNEQADELLSWYQSPTGRKFVAADVKANGADDEPSALLKKGMDELGNTPRRRVALYKEYVKASRQAELATTLTLRMMTAVAVSTAKMQGMTDPAMLTAIVQKMQSNKQAMVDQMYSLALAGSAVRYKPMTDAEVERLVAFERTPSEQKFADTVVNGLDKAMVAAMVELVDAIGQPAKRKTDTIRRGAESLTS
ncbi:hypothetical protein [Ottowia sp.]|uniref:hypothetical protein n=1 Tax=Ottowia sp. TaxID=1898956 RepID=UPI0025F1C445|nr:hypothetical protein [Ottowia sp.]MBK6616185.1 DUF2059 domain-containing protein [Ottowia sp.]